MPPPPSQAEPSSAWPAIIQVVVGVLLFSTSDVTSKYLRQSLPAVEIAWLRYVVFLLVGIGLARRQHVERLWPRRPGLQVLRGVMLLGSAVFFIAGLSFLPMADASAISFVSPAFITALSVLFLGEKVGVHRWAATLVGLLGVVIVVRPGGGTLQVAALWPLSSAACWAVAMIATRKIGTQDRSETTLLWSAGTGLVLLSAMLPLAFTPPSWTHLLLGVYIGVAASTGQYLLILAYRRASASVLAPFSYAQILFAAAMGFLVFGAVPDRWAFTGAAVIIASGLYIVHRERVRGRRTSV